MRSFVTILCSAVAAFQLCAQDAAPFKVDTDRANALYQVGEAIRFTAEAPAAGKVEFKLTADDRDVLGTGTVELKDGRAEIAFTPEAPGFVVCSATWKDGDETKETAVTGAGVSVEKIRQGQSEPADFDAFWAAGKAEAAQVPFDVQIEAAPELSTETLDVSRISFANIDNTRLYGFLSIPKNAPPQIPAVVVVPGAAPAQNAPGGHLLEGVITLFLNVHSYAPSPLGTPTEDAEKVAYQGAHYPHIGADDRNQNFFRRAWLGMDRATEWLRQHPRFDGKNLGVCGWSQGGGSTLALAGLNPNFTYAVANQPAISDHGAYLQGRTPGWPFYANAFNADLNVMQEVAYVDVANFARRIQCPTIVLVGFVDGACRPGTVYAAYNNIPAANKEIVNEPNTNHTWNEAYTQARQKMVDHLLNNR